MKTKENKNLKDKKNTKLKRKISIITVFLWIFLITTMVTIVISNIKSTNALESNDVEIYEEISKLNDDDTSSDVTNNKPEPPTVDKIFSSSGNNMVQFVCIGNQSHNAVSSSLKNNEAIVVGEVIENDESNGVSSKSYPWICDISLNLDFWINLYNEYANSNGWENHLAIYDNVSLRLYYEKDKDMWSYKKADIPIEIKIIEQPTVKTIDNSGSQVVKIECDGNSSHSRSFFNLISDDSFIVGNIVRNNGNNGISTSTYPYVCDIKLNSKFWLDMYGVSNHWLKNNAQTLKLYYNRVSGKWLFYNIPATITVTHIEPEQLIFNKIVDSGGNDVVKIICKDSSEHTRTEDSFINDNFIEAGEIMLNDDSDGVPSSTYPYMCDIKLKSDMWLNYYNNYDNKDFGQHWITSNENTLRLYYSYDRNLWTCKVVDIPIEIEVSHIKPPYTVIYTDGVEYETVFADQVYKELYANSKTPEFNGTPTREGYEFLGWSPEVKPIISSDDSNEDGEIIYTAIWRRFYTVIYTDGVIGETVFAGQAYEELLEGEKTPEFKGTPTREGYEFLRWSPEVKPIISSDDSNEDGDIIYTAIWRNKSDYDKTGYYKVKHEYYVKDKKGNLTLEGVYNTDSIMHFLNDGETIKVGISNEDEIVDIEVEKKPDYKIDDDEYIYEYVESSGNVVLEVAETKEIVLKYVREEKNDTKIKVEKIWEDENNKYGKRPENVVLQIKNGEEVVSEMSVSEENNWSCEFVVPKYDKDGNEIKYTIDEKETSKFYEKIIDGYIVINRYIGEEERNENIDTSDINVFMYVLVFFVAIIGVIVVINIVRKRK